MKIHGLLSVMAGLLLLASCAKDVTAPQGNPGTDTTTTATGIYYKLLHIKNFVGDTTTSSPTAVRPTCFFSLEDTVARSADYARTNRWDLAFGGLYNSFLSGNNGSNPANYGSGTNATGGIYIVSQPFDSVVAIPADNLFKTGKDIYGTDDSGAFGSGVGWYLYDFTGTVMNGDPHICYPIANRTLIVRTAQGSYAKIKIISIYKDNPLKPTTHWPAPYFTFDYVMVPKGSTRFDIK